jgi:hypothetical protein
MRFQRGLSCCTLTKLGAQHGWVAIGTVGLPCLRSTRVLRLLLLLLGECLLHLSTFTTFAAADCIW